MSKIFSVIVPYYNSSRWLESLRKSILSNSMYILEVIIVDDFSSADEREILVCFCNANGFKVVFSAQNGGPSLARNSGAKVARGRYLAFHDADDLWLSGRLKYIFNILNTRPGINFLVNQYTYDGSQLASEKPVIVNRLSPYQLLSRCYLQPSCFIASRSAFFEFSEQYRYSEDFMYQLELLSRGLSLYLYPAPFTILGRPQGSDGGLSGDRFKMRLGELRAYYKFCRQSWFRLPLFPLLFFYSVAKHFTRGFRGHR